MKLLNNLLIAMESFRTKLKINPYVFAFVALGSGLISEFVINMLLKQDTYLLLIISVFFAAWYGGLLPGLAASVLGFLLADYFFIHHGFALLQTPREYIRGAIFLTEGILFSLFSESRKMWEQKSIQAYDAEQKARKGAEDASKIRDEFISIASHELKAPITSQKAYIQLLEKLIEKNDNKEYKKYIEKIEIQTNKMTDLINNLLDVAKIKSGKLEFSYSKFNLMNCINAVLEEMEVNGIRHQLIVEGEITKQIYGDKERIEQVLTNLLSNAIKYSPNAKKVIINILEKRKFCIISIKDYGIGISKENQRKLFNKYFRVQGNNQKQFRGFGMGLFIVSEIIKQHKGRIAVTSNLGKGSTFTITLPYR